MTTAKGRHLAPDVVDVLFAVSVMQPIRLQQLYAALTLPREAIRDATQLLLESGLIVGRPARGFTMSERGWRAISSSKLRNVRDMSRLLYLWTRQKGGG